MAADNAEQQCARCRRASRDKFVAPPEVPAEFWQGEPLREAFAAQHIGRVVRAYRMSPHHHAVHGPTGIAQGLLGQWFGLSQSQISKIETGPPILSLDTLRHWARVLRIPQEWLWFDLTGQGDKSFRSPDDTDDDVVPAPGSAAGPTASSPVSLGSFLGGNLDPLLRLAGEDDEEMMKRRAFVQAAILARLGLGVGGTAAILEAVRHELDRSIADERGAAGVDEWQAIALDYRQTSDTILPATLLQMLLVDLCGLRLAMQRHPGERAQRELVRVGALLAGCTAGTVGDLGDLVEARRWWRSARRAADEAADPDTMFVIRVDEVVSAGYERRPVRDILQLVNDAEARLGKAPGARLPGFWAGKAQTLALAGRHGEAEQALCQVRECSDKLPTSIGHSDPFDWKEEHLRHTESFVYSHAGSFAEAEQAQLAALALYTDSNLRAAAMIELHRALCLVRSGDLALGAGHAQAVITDLPVMHRVRPVADLGQKVLDAIPANERRHSWAQEYRECLESSLPGEGAGNSLPGTARA